LLFQSSLKGIIEGAAHGKGRGRQVIAVAKSSDLILMVLDAAKERGNRHKEILERELHTVGLRLNQKPPNVTVTQKPGLYYTCLSKKKVVVLNLRLLSI
jgi:ribosome-interacting GTPase 1